MDVKEVFGSTIEKARRMFGSVEERDIHRWLGDNPHANFEQSHPAVNKEEPAAFANPVEAGAKRRSEDVAGRPMPHAMPDSIQPGSSASCAGAVHTRMGSDPHATFEQCHPAVNKEEPRAFANPCECGAKKPSEDATGKPMREFSEWSHSRSV